jgi:putative DNA primase/helicase
MAAILLKPAASPAYLNALQDYLCQEYPGVVIMPARKGGKAPLMPHKNESYDVKSFRSEGINKCQHGAMLLLSRRIVVVDVDSLDLAAEFCRRFPEFTATVCTKTRNGKHFYFRDPPEWITDGSRQLGAQVPVDFKTGSLNPKKTANGVISIPPSPGKNYERILGIVEIQPMSPEFLHYILQTPTCKWHAGAAARASGSTPDDNQGQQQKMEAREPCDLQEVDELMAMLSADRAVDRTTWLHVGFCLNNLKDSLVASDELLKRWMSFSMLCPSKYDEAECRRQWQSMGQRPGGIGVGSLHYWARTDSPDRYQAWLITRHTPVIEECDLTHNAVAEVASRLLKGLFICASSESKLWYRFTGSLWAEDKSGVSVHHALASTVRQVFIQTIQKMRARMRESEDGTSTGGSKMLVLDSGIQRLTSITKKLQNDGFKTAVVKVMREYMYEPHFMDLLDSNYDLIGFENGVFCLASCTFRNSTPEDMVSLSVGYSYNSCPTDPDIQEIVDTYFAQLHPDPEQRDYVIRMFARQLLGDSGMNLVHVHAGVAGSGANGKTSFFQVLGHVLGQYVNKFGVELLTAKERPSPGKPMPEFANWKGRRIIYCTEPTCDERLNSGVLKDLSGSELISYRLLYSNDVQTFKPQFKIHLLTNDAPRLESGDQGISRRVRKIDYVSRFVPAADVDVSNHRYPMDETLLRRVEKEPAVKLAFMKTILAAFDRKFDFTMPPVVARCSRDYLSDNDNILQFVSDCFERAPAEEGEVFFVTLKDARALAAQEGIRMPLGTFKTRLAREFGTECLEQKKINGIRYSHVFLGWRVQRPDAF